MQPYLHVVTLGVDDLERALAFYRDGLGLPTQGIIGTEFKGSATTTRARRRRHRHRASPQTPLGP